MKLRELPWSDPVYDVTIVLYHGPWLDALAAMNKRFGDVTEANTGRGEGAKTLWIERPRGCALVLWFPAWFNSAALVRAEGKAE